MQWETASYADVRCQQLISRHYCRRRNSDGYYNRVGYSLVLYTKDAAGREAVFIWWRPKWETGLPQAQRFDGLKAIECVIFRNETEVLSSDLIRLAVDRVLGWEHAEDVVWPDGLITSVDSKKTARRRGKRNPPGYCFIAAGWERIDGKRTKNTDVWLRWSGKLENDVNVRKWLEDRRRLGFSGRGAGYSKQQKIRREPGTVYGKLRVLEYAGLYPRADGHRGGDPIWKCRCACGTEITARQSFLRVGDVKSCGRCDLVTVRRWSEQLLRKLALSIEFEGTLGVYGGSGPRMTVVVRDYSEGLLHTMRNEFGVGEVTFAVFAEGGKGRAAQWQVSGAEVVAIAKAVLPFMVCKKQQAELVANYELRHRRVRLTPEVRQERARLWTLTKELNKRGPRDTKSEWKKSTENWVSWAKTATTQQRAELLAWAIEWEGFIGVHEKKSFGSAHGVAHGVLIGLPQVSHRVSLLEIGRALAGGYGGISGVLPAKYAGWSPMQRWSIEEVAAAKLLAQQLVPYLQCKKRLAELVLEFPEWGQAPEPMPEDIFLKRRALAEESKRLNA